MLGDFQLAKWAGSTCSGYMMNSEDMNAEERVLRVRLRSDCPCGSGQSYNDCCRPYHTGAMFPETAEQLMRSRYTAYFFRLTDYLVGTHHPDTRPKGLREELDEIAHDLLWRSLTILNSSKGQATDKKGKVEFIAQYHYDGELTELHEKSRFLRHKGRWKYLDGRG